MSVASAHLREKRVLPIGSVITTRIAVPGWTVVERREAISASAYNKARDGVYVLRSNTHPEHEHRMTFAEMSEAIASGLVNITTPDTMPTFAGDHVMVNQAVMA